jgi:hypothetical protein
VLLELSEESNVWFDTDDEEEEGGGAHFTCFTGTKIQILVQKYNRVTCDWTPTKKRRAEVLTLLA